VRHQGVRLSYAQLREQVDALACGLLRLGLVPGDRIGIWSQNNLEWVLAQFAAAKAGLILVNINPAYRRRELEYALNKVGCRALILAPHFKSSCYLEILTSLAVELPAAAPGRLRSAALPGLQWVIRLGAERSPGMLNLDDLLTAPAAQEPMTAEVRDPSGWMHTGDLATLDEQGYCNIVGRIKDVVIRGGENVYPREIEEFLYQHPEIRDVQVVGVPDRRYGEELCAWIILHAGATLDADGVSRFCEGQIAHYKIPRYIRFVDAFPLTVTGKVQKYLIREQMKRELGLDEGRTA
jgi:acyl-CoA synthetase (AMP-forming)/AMP-acid ligase II